MQFCNWEILPIRVLRTATSSLCSTRRTHRPLHVIGNHDTDAGFTKDNCIDKWGIPSRYYARDIEGLQLLVLDGNDAGSPTHKGGYVSYVGKEQVEWLKEQLATLDGPIMVACHQPLAGAYAVDNAEEIQAVLGDAARQGHLGNQWSLTHRRGHSRQERYLYACQLCLLQMGWQCQSARKLLRGHPHEVSVDFMHVPLSRFLVYHPDGRA